jgi:hypothetical protein
VATKDRKTVLFERLKEQEIENKRFEIVETEPIDVIAEAEARHLAEALDPERAPEWMRPAVHGQYMAPDAKVALSRLAMEEKDAQDKVDAVKKARQAIEEAAIAEQQRLEAQAQAQDEVADMFNPLQEAGPYEEGDQVQEARDGQ